MCSISSVEPSGSTRRDEPETPKVASYLLALFVSALALYLRHSLVPVLGESNPYFTAWLAIIFCSWYCGVGPSILGTVLNVLGIIYFFLPPFHSLLIKSRTERNGVLWFVLFSAAIIALGESNRRAATLRVVAESRLKAANENLEIRVDERTAELRQMNESLLKQTAAVRELSGRLLNLRDQERRHIARELHDSVGQLLTAVSMNMARLQNHRGRLSPEAAECVEESAELVRQAASEIRTMSHLLHPPLLEEVGLTSAIRWFVQGFAERSGIGVDLRIAPNVGRFADDLELAIFRILQECLTNIHRHSGSKTARVGLRQGDGYVHCEIEDDGKGISPEKQEIFNSSGAVGVGLRGMRERVAQLGGMLNVHSTSQGTIVTAVLPAKSADGNPLHERSHSPSS